MAAALNIAKQRHPEVPSSNQPPIQEWAGHYWYVIRAMALQASEDLDDNEASHLVNFMASLAVGLPCPECRDHFIGDWLEDPYTLDHAKNHHLSMHWVEELRRKTDLRVLEKKRAAAGAGAGAEAGAPPPGPRRYVVTSQTPFATITRPVVIGGNPADVLPDAGDADADAAETAAPTSIMSAPAAPRPMFYGSSRRRRPMVRTTGPAAVAAIARATGGAGPMPESGASAALRSLAITSALHVTRANKDGRRMGCNCAPSHKGGPSLGRR